MIYLTKLLGVGALFIVSLWIAPLPDPGEPIGPLWDTDYAPPAAILPPTSPVETTKPATPTTTTPTPVLCSEWAEYGRRFGWPENEIDQLTVIMGLESGCNPSAIGDNGNSYGLLQLHCPTWVAKSTYWPNGWAAANGYPITCNDLLDPATNLAIGFLIWAGVPGSSGGWWNWTTYKP